MRKYIPHVTALALLAVLLVATGATGTVAAADSSTELRNTTFTVDNDTESVRIVAEGTNGTLDAAIYGLEGSNETEVTNTTLSADSGNTTTFEWPVNASAYSQYRVVVTGNGSEYLEVSKLQAMTGGGGGLLAGGVPAGQEVLAVVVVAVLLVVAALYDRGR